LAETADYGTFSEITGVSYDWIIEEINMGSRASVYNAIKAVAEVRGAKKREWEKLCNL
jgi:hypothetical protein